MSLTRSLYRFFDADGGLLYVGRTINAQSRWRTHERTKEWFDSVATITREVLPDDAALALAERDAIRREGPLHNVVLNTPDPIPAPPAGVEPRLLSHDTAAAYLGVNVAEMDRLGATEFEQVRIDSAVRYDRHDLDDYLARAAS